VSWEPRREEGPSSSAGKPYCCRKLTGIDATMLANDDAGRHDAADRTTVKAGDSVARAARALNEQGG